MRSLMSQVLALLSRTWLHDRLDVGDRLNADRMLPVEGRCLCTLRSLCHHG